MAKLSTRTAAVVGDIVDTAIMWIDDATSASSYKAAWLTIRTKLEDYFVTKATYDANTILAATSDNTPAAVTVAEQTLVGRITGGSIDDLSIAQVNTLLSLKLNNFTATTDPGVGDDDADGYEVGSEWLNTVSGDKFYCADASTGAAVWNADNGLNQSQVDARVVAVAPTANQAIGVGPATTFTVSETISDDAVATFAMPLADVSAGTLLFATTSSTMAGSFAFRPRTGPWMLTIAKVGNLNTTTGTLTGTTGTDGFVTISATGSNTLMVENRTGGALFAVLTIGVTQ